MKFNILLLALITTEASTKKSNSALRRMQDLVSETRSVNSSFRSSSSESQMMRKSSVLNLKGPIIERFGVISLRYEYDTIDKTCTALDGLFTLAKLALGASNAAFVELAAALGVANKSELVTEMKRIVNLLRSLQGDNFKFVSQLFISSRFKMEEAYTKELLQLFNTRPKVINFASTAVASTIDDWVSNQTGGYVQQITADSQLDYGESLVSISALYFRGEWGRAFTASNKSQPFHSEDGTKFIRMMHSTDSYRYIFSSTLDAQVVQIPYYKGELSLVVVLPTTTSSLFLLLKKIRIAPELLREALSLVEKRFVNISLPIFTTSTTMTLTEQYKRLGVYSIFSRKARGLRYMTTNKKLHVSETIQKCIVEISEKGVSPSPVSPPANGSKPIIVMGNRPFYYFVLAENIRLLEGVY